MLLGPKPKTRCTVEQFKKELRFRSTNLTICRRTQNINGPDR